MHDDDYYGPILPYDWNGKLMGFMLLCTVRVKRSVKIRDLAESRRINIPLTSVLSRIFTPSDKFIN